MLFQPQVGWRNVKVTQRRTITDYAHCRKDLADTHFPNARIIRVVQDNLNTHTPWSLYAAFPPDEARRIRKRLDFHNTPKHTSWLDLAAIEISVLGRQCLDRRIGDDATLEREIAAWEAARNAAHAKMNWQFSVTDARTKLKRLYPS